MKRSAIIAITLALASAAVAAPNGLGQATNPNRAMRSRFAPRQRNNITNDIENARANAKRDFIRSQDEYKAIDSRAEEKFKLILEDNCRNWKAGCGKGVIISDGNSNSIVYGEDGRLLEISSWEDLETTKWIKSEQQRIEQSIIETKSAEITAVEDAAEKAVRDRYAEQEENDKSRKEATKNKLKDDEAAKLSKYEKNFDSMLSDLFGLSLGVEISNLTVITQQTATAQFNGRNRSPRMVNSEPQIELPKKFRHYTSARCKVINGIVYGYTLVDPFDKGEYSASSIQAESDKVLNIIEEKTGTYVYPSKKSIVRMNSDLTITFTDSSLKEKLETTQRQKDDASKKQLPELKD